MQFNFSLYNAKIEQFFGRTYQSILHKAVKQENTIYVAQQKGSSVDELLYFNTTSTDEGVYLVIEPVIAIKTMASGEISYQSPGFFMYKVFDLEGKFEY